jgi:hypothetical protein
MVGLMRAIKLAGAGAGAVLSLLNRRKLLQPQRSRIQ